MLRIKAIYPDAEIHTFEPFPKLAQLLQQYVTNNGWQDVPGESMCSRDGGRQDAIVF